jgi:hypothetical protein
MFNYSDIRAAAAGQSTFIDCVIANATPLSPSLPQIQSFQVLTTVYQHRIENLHAQICAR